MALIAERIALQVVTLIAIGLAIHLYREQWPTRLLNQIRALPEVPEPATA